MLIHLNERKQQILVQALEEFAERRGKDRPGAPYVALQLARLIRQPDLSGNTDTEAQL